MAFIFLFLVESRLSSICVTWYYLPFLCHYSFYLVLLFTFFNVIIQHFKGTLQQGQETWANQTTNHTTENTNENTTGYLNYGERRRLQNN